MRVGPKRGGETTGTGFTLVEVVVAMAVLLVALAAVASLLATTLKTGANSRDRLLAANVAASSLDSLVELGSTTLLSEFGEASLTPVTVGNQTFHLERDVGSYEPSGAVCSSPRSDPQAGLKVTVWATWTHVTNGSTWWRSTTGSVVQQSSVVPVASSALNPADGSILVSVVGASGEPIGGVSVTVTPSTGTPLTTVTTQAGCALFANVATGTWTVSGSEAGYIDNQDDFTAGGSPSPLSGTASVTAQQTSTLSFTYDQAATVTAQYSAPLVSGQQPNLPTNISSLPLSFYNSSLTNNPAETVNPAKVFPFSQSPSYDVVAGTCGADSKPSGDAGTAVTLQPGGSTNAAFSLVPLDVVVTLNGVPEQGATLTASNSNAAGNASDPNCPGSGSPAAMPVLSLGSTCTGQACTVLAAYHRTRHVGRVTLARLLSSPRVGGTSSRTSLTSSATSFVYGTSSPPTYTATVSGSGKTPTGSVTFTYGATTLCGSVPLSTSGKATCTPSGTILPVGSDTVTASYSGDTTYATSSKTVTETVTAAASTVTVTSTANPSTYGTPPTFTATVSSSSGTPSSGSITFTEGTTTLCAATSINANGTATCQSPTLGVGANTVTATYSGGGNYAGSSGQLTETVNPSNTNPSDLTCLPYGVWLIGATYTTGGHTYLSTNASPVVVTVTPAGISVNGGPIEPAGSTVVVAVQ